MRDARGTAGSPCGARRRARGGGDDGEPEEARESVAASLSDPVPAAAVAQNCPAFATCGPMSPNRIISRTARVLARRSARFPWRSWAARGEVA